VRIGEINQQNYKSRLYLLGIKENGVIEALWKKILALLAFFAAFALLAAVPAPPAYAASVSVTVAQVPVFLNGVAVDNEGREYPLITYKDIVYFPMTWHDCRFLGLETEWDAAAGLKIKKSNVTGGYYAGSLPGVSANRQTALITAFPVSVNGKTIDNGQEEYPLLLFRNVTYFPLTWRFAADEFGWNYFYDRSGLHIDTTKKDPQAAYAPAVNISEVTLPGRVGLSAVTANGFFFYADGKNVLRAPVSNPSNPVIVLREAEIGDWHGTLKGHKFEDKTFLYMPVGSPTMGTDLLYCVEDDGSLTRVDQFVTEIDGISVRIGASIVAGAPLDNLTVKTVDDAEFRKIGDPNFCYGNVVSYDGNYLSITRKQAYEADLYYMGRYLYLLGADRAEFSQSSSKICRVNVDTGENTVLNQAAADKFYIRDGSIYFMNEKKQLSTMDLDGGSVKTLLDTSVKTFVLFGDDVYYVSSEDDGIFRFSDGVSVNPGAKALHTMSARDNLTGKEFIRYDCFAVEDQYLWCSFQLTDVNPYSAFLISREGNIVYQYGPEADKLLIDGNNFYILK
jgi:hypothetical protein